MTRTIYGYALIDSGHSLTVHVKENVDAGEHPTTVCSVALKLSKRNAVAGPAAPVGGVLRIWFMMSKN